MGRTNLTIDYVVRNADFSASPGDLARIEGLRDSINQFLLKIVPARNRLIGHLDRVAVMTGKALGGASDGDWQQFWDDLDEFLHVVYTRYVDPGGSFYLSGVGMFSDADSVVKALKESTYFHRALDNNDLTQKVADIAFGSEFFNA